MVEQGRNMPNRPMDDEEASEGLDLEQIKELAGFVAGAPKRHPVLASSVFIVVAALGVTVSVTMPKTFSSEVRLLAQRASAIRMLSGNQQMENIDNPTRNVAAMITRRDNLEALVKDAHLVERFAQTRPAPLRFKDKVMATLFGPPSPDDMEKVMIYTLERNLDVAVTEDSNVKIAVEWANPQIAYDLATLVEKNFLEARYDSDVAVINDSIAVLEDHGRTELEQVDAALAEYQKLLAERTTAERAAARAERAGLAPIGPLTPAPATVRFLTRPAAAGAASAGAASVDVDLAQRLEEKRAQIRAIEDAQRTALADVRKQLMEAQLTLTPMHPTVVALQQQLDTMSQPSGELAQARAEERALMAQIAPPRAAPSAAPAAPVVVRSAALQPADSASAAASASASAPPLSALPAIGIDRDGTVQLASSKLAAAIRNYQDATARIDAARVELEITRTGYKHRYTVVAPAELPKKPKKATAQIIGIGSVVGAAVLAIVLATLADMLAGTILEAWQVRRRLKIEVLGEFDGPG
jgi:uncharacterized protein involved in exopolysaccharide biosynthesis